MGTKFSTRVEKICAFCHEPFIAKVPRAMYCSKLCKGRALAKPAKRDSESGLWPKTCTRCHKDFLSKSKNARMCPECSAESQRESIRKWHRNNPEWQEKWNSEHPESLKKSRKKWCLANPDKVAEYEKKHEGRKAMQRLVARRSRAIEFQKVLAATATKCGPASKLDPMEFMDSIGIVRITANFCRCTRCSGEFYVAKKETSAYRNLKRYAKTGKSPCPYCGDTPFRHSVSNGGSATEFEINNLYPNFTEHGYKPEWMGGKEIDLYDPVAKVGLEFHGLYAHSERRCRDSNSHKVKADLAEKAGIQLIQLYESEWVQSRECVIDKLDAIFHRSMRRIPARKLDVRILVSRNDHELANRFMDENHIQGHSSMQWGVALMEGSSPVAVCTFKLGTGYAAGGHVENTEKYWELNRFATKLHTCVQGGLSRCISAFWKEHPEVDEIFSFADRRWTCPTRSAYSSSGFVEVDRQRPNYMYTNLDPNEPLKNKQFMRKSRIKERSPEIYSDEKTEFQMAHELGYYRIYDAGKIKYRMERPQ